MQNNLIDNNIQSLINTAVQKHQLGKLDEAESIYRQILQIQPDGGEGKVSSENRYYLIAITNLGIILQQQGQLSAAVESYQQALSLKPDWAQAHYNLGNALGQQGQLSAAVESYQQALTLKPDWAQAHYNLGNTLQQQGQLEAAIKSYQQALSLKPNTAVYNNLGNALQQQGQLEAARESYQQALSLKPDWAQAHYNLGSVLQQQGQLSAAVESYQQALSLKPGWAQAYSNLGSALKQQGQLEAAIKSYQQALSLEPDAAVYNNLGNALKEQGQLEAARESYQQALSLKPDLAEAYQNLGNVLKEQGQLSAAVESYQQALSLKPDLAEAYLNLGNALKEQGQLEAARESYQQALSLKPDLAEAYQNLGNVLREQGQLCAAVKSYQQALKLEPDLAYAKFSICLSQLPIIYSTFEEISERRNQYQQHLQKLAQSYQMANQKERAKAAEAVGSSHPFYLAYQGLNDRDLQQTYGEMICQLMSSRYPQDCQPIPIPTLEAKEKIRVGFVSGFFKYHSIWKIPIQGWIENLDRNQFELFGYYTDSKQDQFTARATQAFVKFVQGPLTVEKWCEAIAVDKPHILIFPEIGMDPITVQLACLRLAPVQIVFGGHPETTGLPTIDYHLSSDLMEPENAQDHYTEKLVRLPNLAIHYSPVEIQPKAITKTEIGLKNDEIMFWCCQSLFKYLPQHDDVFPRIAQELANCKFVFIKHHQSEQVTEVFRQRLSRAFGEVGLDYQDYCIFLPRLDSKAFAGTTAIADVFLDNIGWSGNNTTMESLVYNIPIVTWPGELMRGRHAMAILKMMGIEQTIASSKQEYVKIAVRLGQERQYRQQISRQIAENKHKLYGDWEPIKALENFLLNAVDQERRIGSTVGRPTVSQALKLALGHHRANRLDQAMEVYNQILSQQPQHPEALYGLGVLAQQRGQYQKAEKFLQGLLAVQPKSVKGWFSLGNLRQAQGQLPEAVEAYQQALVIEPDSVAVLNNLGYTLQLQGKWEEAITCYQKALTLQPDCAQAQVNLGNALYAQGSLSPEKQAEYAGLNYHLGVARQKAGDFKTAVVYYQQAIAMKPDLVEAHDNLGVILQEQGEL